MKVHRRCIDKCSDLEIETAIVALGREPQGGLVVMPDVFMNVHRAPIISAAARNNIPAVYYLSAFARDGGLLSYGPDPVDGLPRRCALRKARYCQVKTKQFGGGATDRFMTISMTPRFKSGDY